MPQSLLEQLIASLSGPRPRNQNTDAPGTNSRVDITTPDQVAALPDSGKGRGDTLGYYQHGDPRIAAGRAEAAHADSLARFPGVANLGKAGPVVPEYNVFYGPYRNLDYQNDIVNSAHGTLAPGVTNSSPVTLDAPANLRTSQYPGAILVYPVLHLWSWSNSVTTATGQYSFTWTLPGSDFPYPLGEYIASAAGDFKDKAIVIPAPVVDPGITTLGVLTVAVTALVGAPTINWRMGLGWAYLLPVPAFRGPVPLAVPVPHSNPGAN